MGYTPKRGRGYLRRDEVKGARYAPMGEGMTDERGDPDEARTPYCGVEDMLYHDAVETVDGASTPNRPQARKKAPDDTFEGG